MPGLPNVARDRSTSRGMNGIGIAGNPGTRGSTVNLSRYSVSSAAMGSPGRRLIRRQSLHQSRYPPPPPARTPAAGRRWPCARRTRRRPGRLPLQDNRGPDVGRVGRHRSSLDGSHIVVPWARIRFRGYLLTEADNLAADTAGRCPTLKPGPPGPRGLGCGPRVLGGPASGSGRRPSPASVAFAPVAQPPPSVP